jgi:predicted Zn finger-like uncharacterized protein
MKFVCDRCLTKYSIADEKVRGRILKVRCKSCSNVITVKESAPAAPGHALGGGEGESERTVINSGPHAASAAFAAASARVRPAVLVPPPPPPAAPDDDVQWFLAVEGVQKGPFTRKLLVDKLIALPRDAEAHVWNETLDGWKPPKEVPVVARDLQSRSRLVAPPPPPPPSRPRAVPPPPSQHASQHGTASPRGLPGPAGTPHNLRALGLGTPVADAGALSGGADPSAMLETPAPIREMYQLPRGQNGTSGHGAAAAPLAPLANGESDALNALNLGGTWHQQPAQAGPASTTSPEWRLPGGAAPAVGAQGRSRTVKLIAAFLGIVAICVVLLFNFVLKRTPWGPAGPADKSKAGAGPEPSFADLAKKLADEERAAKEKADEDAKAKANGKTPDDEAKAPATAPPPFTGKPETVARVSGGGKKPIHVVANRGAGAHPNVTPPPLSGLTPEQQAAAARFGDTSQKTVQIKAGGGGGPKITPSQTDIARVVNNNKGGIKVCYQRALLRDSTLTHGKITVRVSIGLSGKVKNVGVDGPAPFRALEPCIKDVLSRWAFPASSEEYGTEFSYLFQGNE